MSKLITQSETDYLNHFGEFMVRWTKEIVDLTMGKPKEDSWIWRGGFRVTSLGRTMVDKVLTEKPTEMSRVLIYIGFQNLSTYVPTVDQISSKFFKRDFNKTLKVLNGLVTACAVQFLEEDPNR